MERPLRLYEAIRLGAMLRPQIRGRLFGEGGSCALGAAIEATGTKYGTNSYDAIPERFAFSQYRMACSLIGPGSYRIVTIVEAFNDTHKWTREAIADWLEPIEEAWLAAREQQPEAEEVATIAELMGAK